MVIFLDEGRIRGDVMFEVSGVSMMVLRGFKVSAALTLLHYHLPWHWIELINIVFILILKIVLRGFDLFLCFWWLLSYYLLLLNLNERFLFNLNLAERTETHGRLSLKLLNCIKLLCLFIPALLCCRGICHIECVFIVFRHLVINLP